MYCCSAIYRLQIQNKKRLHRLQDIYYCYPERCGEVVVSGCPAETQHSITGDVQSQYGEFSEPHSDMDGSIVASAKSFIFPVRVSLLICLPVALLHPRPGVTSLSWLNVAAYLYL